MENELIKCSVIVILFVLITLFEMLVNAGKLSSCAAPMHIWVVVEVLLLAAPLGMCCIDASNNAQVLFWAVVYIFSFWNFGGWLMYLYIKAESPDCMP